MYADTKKVGIGRTHSLIDLSRNSWQFKKKLLIFVLTFSLIISEFLTISPRVYAASSPWSQTNWAGGDGQTSWSDITKYLTGSNVTASAANQVTITNTEKFTNTGFETDLSGWNTGAQPDSISGLQIWLDSSDPTTVFQDSSFTTPAVNDGDPIGGWKDKSGHSNNVTQTGTNRPTLKLATQNGRNTILQSSSANPLSGAFNTTLSSYTVFVVDKQTDGGADKTHFRLSSEVNSFVQVWNYNNNYIMRQRNNSWVMPSVATGVATNNIWSIFEGTWDGSTLSALANGGSLSTVRATGAITVSTQLTGDIDGYAMGGHHGEIIVYNTSLSIANRIRLENYLRDKWNIAISSGITSVARDTTTKYAGNASTKLVTSSTDTGEFTQIVNVGDTNTYNLSAYAYITGAAVSSSNVELFYNGSTVTTSYTPIGSTGWYQLTGKVAGVNASRNYGVQVKANNTVYVDNISLNNYSSGTLTSSIFDSGQGSDWGALTYVATTPTNTSVSVKVRTGNQSDLLDAAAFISCSAISSGSTVMGTTCATNKQRYVQYQLSLANTDSVSTPIFTSFSLAFTVSDILPPSISLTALSPDPNNDNTPSLSVSATDTGGTVSNAQYQMDGTSGTWTACTADDGSFNSATENFICNVPQALSDGSHTIYVRATDSNGNTTSDVNTSTDTYTIDTTAPTISITALTPDPINDNTPSISGTATDVTTALTAIEYQVDSTTGSWTTCSANDGTINQTTEVFTCTTDSLSDGAHTIYIRAIDSTSNTTTLANYSTDSFTVDTEIPTVTLIAIFPNPGTDNTPTISGSATDIGGTISKVKFQADSTTGSWTSCTASDIFYSATESFSCTTLALSEGAHTVYVRATDNAGNNSNNVSDNFTVDITAPASFNLDSPGDNSYTNSERPSFKWKATSDATSGLSKYSIEVDNGDSGDFSIDYIPTSRTTDYITNKYVAHYENFSDSDSTNNYISVYTKSTNDWGSDNNDGKLKEGKRSWKVKAADNTGNERSESQTLFVDRTSPIVEVTQINDTKYSSNGFATNDKTPTIYGKIRDSLFGDKTDSRVASGPKNAEIKIEKKNNLGLYDLQTIATVNLNETYWTNDGSKINDNSENKSDKYSTFEFTLQIELPLGNYSVLITGKDSAGNFLSAGTFYLDIVTYEQVTTPEEKKIVEEGIKLLTPEEKDKIKQKLEVTKPTEPVKPTVLQTTVDTLIVFQDKLFKATTNLTYNISGGIGKGVAIAFNGIGNEAKFIFNSFRLTYAFMSYKTGQVLAFVGHGIRTTVDSIGQELTFARDKIGKVVSFVGKEGDNGLTALYKSTTSILVYGWQGEKNVADAIRRDVFPLAKRTVSLLASIGQGIGNTGKTIGQEHNQLVNNAPGVTKTILTVIRNRVSTTISNNAGNAIGNASKSITSATSTIAQTTSKVIRNIAGPIESVTRKTGATIANATQDTINATKEEMAKIAFNLGEKIQGVSDSTGYTIIYIGYLFVNKPTKISDVKVVALSSTSVKITWVTNHPANGKVNYGLDETYPFDIQSEKRLTFHKFTITNLKPDTQYYFEVMSHNKNYVYDANRKFKTPAE